MFESTLLLQALTVLSTLFHLLLFFFMLFFSIVGAFVLYEVVKGYLKEKHKQKEKRLITEKYSKFNNKDYFKSTNS